MQLAMLMTSIIFFQDPTEATRPAPAKDMPRAAVRVDVSMHCFRSKVEVPQESLNINEFLADPNVQEQKLWSNNFAASTLLDSELNISVGENRSLVTGMTVGQTGRSSPNLMMRKVGTILKMTPAMANDGRIQTSIHIETTQVEDGDPDADLTVKMVQTGISELQHSSSVLTESGKPEVIIITQDDATNPKKSRTYVIVATLTTFD